MLTLIQFPWSPFCITIRHMLDRHGVQYRLRNIPNHDRTAVIEATGGRGYTVPCVVDGRQVVWDQTAFGQEVARYVDAKYKMGLFPAAQEGAQYILARYIESELEDIGFRVNDSYVIPRLPLVERVMVTRHKERKFGKGCVAQWVRERRQLKAEMARRLAPLDNILASAPFLLGDRPLFVDYDLYGVLGNYLYSGRTRLSALPRVRAWRKSLQSPAG
jgi:glutathione S-transferase